MSILKIAFNMHLHEENNLLQLLPRCESYVDVLVGEPSTVVPNFLGVCQEMKCDLLNEIIYYLWKEGKIIIREVLL